MKAVLCQASPSFKLIELDVIIFGFNCIQFNLLHPLEWMQKKEQCLLDNFALDKVLYLAKLDRFDLLLKEYVEGCRIRLDQIRFRKVQSHLLGISPPAQLSPGTAHPLMGLNAHGSTHYTLHTTQQFLPIRICVSQFLPSRAGAQQKNLPCRRRITEDEWFKDGNDEEGKELESWGFKFLEEKTYTYPISKKAH